MGKNAFSRLVARFAIFAEVEYFANRSHVNQITSEDSPGPWWLFPTTRN